MTVAQQLPSAWFRSASLGSYSESPLLQRLSQQNTNSAGPAAFNAWWFPPQYVAVGYDSGLYVGPGVSPNAQMQFRGLLPFSNFIQNVVIALTGQSIAFTQGSVSLAFGGQSLTISQGTLTPLIEVPLISNGLWQNLAGTQGPWVNATQSSSPAQFVRSAWFWSPSLGGYPEQILRPKVDQSTTNAAAPLVWTNFWWPIVATMGGWQYATQGLNFTLGTVLPFGINFFVSPPAFVPTIGPGVGPFGLNQFLPRPLGQSPGPSVGLIGSAINSAQGTLSVAIDLPITGISITSGQGTIIPINGIAIGLVGTPITTAQGDLSQGVAISVLLTPNQIAIGQGTITFVIPPGPGNDLWSTIKGLLEAGLIPQVYYTYSNTVPAGIVISLTPPIGTVVPINSPVVILVSTGPGGSPTTIAMPNLTGLYWKDATDLLEANLLSNDKYLWQINPAPEGTVIAQSIPPGSVVAVATIVQLTLSAGQATVVPPVSVP